MQRSEEQARQRLTDDVLLLLRTPTEVPLGEYAVLPGDPRIAEAVEEVVLPRILESGPEEVRRHPAGDAAARFGPPGDDGLLVQTYIVSQHGNRMSDPHSATLEDGTPLGYAGTVARGQGANQNKGPMAAAITAMALLPAELKRPVWLTVNTEGKSSHDGSRRILDDLAVTAAHGVLAFGTDLAVSLGNRGRVDVDVRIPGVSAHSSQPALAVNPILRAAEVLRAVQSLPLPGAHPKLGPATATPYSLGFEPRAPHTIPETGHLVVDRRLLPGETPEGAVAELAEHLRGVLTFEAPIGQGEFMLPAEVPESAPVVGSVAAGLASANREPRTVYSKNTFDAGYACSRGIPTVMFGPGRRSFGADITAAEVVALDDCWAAAVTLASAIRLLCT